MAKELKPITLHNDETDETYILTFTRATVTMAEEGGLGVKAFEEAGDKPLSIYTNLIYYALQANHKGISRAKAMEIADEWLGGVANCPKEVIERLAALYAESYKTLKNSKVTVSL